MLIWWHIQLHKEIPNYKVLHTPKEVDSMANLTPIRQSAGGQVALTIELHREPTIIVDLFNHHTGFRWRTVHDGVFL